MADDLNEDLKEYFKDVNKTDVRSTPVPYSNRSMLILGWCGPCVVGEHATRPKHIAIRAMLWDGGYGKTLPPGLVGLQADVMDAWASLRVFETKILDAMRECGIDGSEAKVTPTMQISRRYHIHPKVNLLTTHV